MYKKLLVVLSLVFLLGCANTKFYFFGVDSSLITQATKKDMGLVLLGAVTSAGTHVAGHWLAGEIWNVDWHFENNYRCERVDYYGSNNDLRWFARGGFVLQHGVGLVLTSFESFRYSYFTKGYVSTAALQTWTYNIRHPGDVSDFRTIDNANGDGDLEFAIYSIVALHNVLRVPWKGDTNE